MCGIFAMVPKDNNTTNWARVKLLLLANESRGRHSTGLYTKTASKKMVENASKFISDLAITDMQLVSPLLGHTRAPSAGANRTISGAQPIIEKNDKDENVFALIHNGTIHNMEELADADDEITFESTDTDSQILAKFLMAEKYDVLADYHGAASLIWHRQDDPNAVYVFRGESPNTQYVKYLSEERPLHVGEDSTGTYFSSTKDALTDMFDDQESKDSVKSVEPNIVFRYENGEEVIVYEVDRSASHQTKKIKPYTPPSTPSKSKYGSYHNPYSYGYDSDGWDDDIYDTPSGKSIKDYKTIEHSKDIANWVSTITEVDGDKLFLDEQLNTAKIPINQVFFYKGTYRTLSSVLNGNRYITPDGKIGGMHDKDVKLYSFVKGVLIREADDFVKAFNAVGANNFGTDEFQVAIKPFASQPVLVLESYGENINVESIYYKGRLFTGTYKPLFFNRGYIEIHAGYLGASFFYQAADLNIGDTIEVVEAKTKYIGVVLSKNTSLGVVNFRSVSGITKRVDECYIQKIITPTTITVKPNDAFTEKNKNIKSPVELKAEQKAEAEKKRKEELEAKIKAKRNAKSDVLSILVDTQVELEGALNNAKKVGVKLPRINRRVYNMIGHAVKSLEPKTN